MATSNTQTKTTEATPKTEEKVETKTVPAHIAKMGTKSAKIRALNQEGWTNSEIVKFGGMTYENGDQIRYQHVYNVLNQKVKGS